MSKNNTKNSQNSRTSQRGLQNLIEDLKKKRDDLNSKTKKYINALQEIETEIETSLKTAKEKFKKKRDYWNKKVKELKDKKLEYKALLDKLKDEKKAIIKSSKNPV